VRFVMLVPKSLDPAARGRKMPLPDVRPSEKIAKLFPQLDPPKDPQKTQNEGPKDPIATPPQPSAAAAQASPSQTVAAKSIPLPEARPTIQPSREAKRHRRRHRHRRR
jgi:membrane-bound lytic murein transglycosylase A